MTIMITIVLSLLLYYIIICTEAVILAHKSSCVKTYLYIMSLSHPLELHLNENRHFIRDSLETPAHGSHSLNIYWTEGDE